VASYRTTIIDRALANRDLVEFYLLAPGIAGGDVHKAEAVAGRIAAIDAAQGFLAKARIAESRKQTGALESLLRQAVDAAPANYRARIALARFYTASDRANPAAAKEHAQCAIQIDSTRVDAYAVLAEIYAQGAQWAKLDGLLTEAAAQVPDDLAPITGRRSA
jgi:tetratricopeptide (TPR) repeat protein